MKRDDPLGGGQALGGAASFGIGLSVALLGVAAVYIVLAPPMVGMDDANIGFRYARNLAEGHGFVFNPGGERVEGVTSLLWVLLQAAIHAVGGPDVLEAGSAVASVLLTGVALGVVVRLLSALSGPAAWVGLAWLAALPAYYLWSGLALMDSALWSAALLLFFAAGAEASRSDEARRWPLAAATALLTLSRPDALLVAPATAFVWWAVTAGRPGARRAGRRAAATVLATALPLLGALTAVRVAYFGYPLPNTYYTKVSPDVGYRLGEGFAYVADYFVAHPVSVVPALIAVGLGAQSALRLLRGVRGVRGDSGGTERAAVDGPWATDDEETRRVVTAAGLFVGIGFASAISVGGDHFADHRFLQAYLPLAALPLAWGASRVALRIGAAPRRTLGAVAVLSVLLVGWEWRGFGRTDDALRGFTMAQEGRAIGALLDRQLPDARPVLGVWQAGGLGYGYTGPVRDLLGLNWVAMGHSPGDRRGVRDHAAFHEGTFWSDPPDLMVPVSLSLVEAVGCPRIVWRNVLRGVMATPRFVEAFEPVVTPPDDEGRVFAYGRTAWLDAHETALERVGWAACGVSR